MFNDQCSIVIGGGASRGILLKRCRAEGASENDN
jgi:hypothetical protein